VSDIGCVLWCLLLRATAGNEVSEQRSECVFGWTAAFRITEDERGCVLHVELRIRLQRDSDVTEEELATAQAGWETAIESKWTDAMPLRRTDGDCACSEYRVEVDVQFVDTNQHHTVQVHSGSGRADMGNWFITSGDRTVAHEAGHMFGNVDEYPEEDRCPDRVTFDDDSIMASGNTVHDRHYQRFADWVSAFTCCDYVPEERKG
jgi:hypothetical protein